jgi:membrane protein
MDLVKDVRTAMKRHQLPLLAAGVAFYALLAVFPAMIALVTVYGLVMDPNKIDEQLEPLTKTLPAGAGDLLRGQLTSIAQTNPGGLTVGLVIGLAATLWAAAGGVRALSTGLTIVRGQQMNATFVSRAAISLALTLGALVTVLVAITLIAVFPAVLNHLGLSSVATLAAQIARWVLLIVLIGLALAVLYHWGPAGPRPPWRWVTWGTVTAVTLWIICSIGFSIYASNFGSYNETYGSLAAVIVLMLWLWLSALAVLLGAEVDKVRSDRASGVGTGPGHVASSGGG